MFYLSAPCRQFCQLPEFGAKTVVFYGSVSESSTNTVLADFHWINTQRTKYFHHLGGLIAVALQFDDDYIAESGVLPCLDILPPETGVDSESFRLGAIDESNSLKAGVQLGLQRRERIPRFLTEPLGLVRGEYP